jgi:hypothetical protein
MKKSLKTKSRSKKEFIPASVVKIMRPWEFQEEKEKKFRERVKELIEK